MADKSFGQFGSYKWICLDENKNPNLPYEQISQHCQYNIKYFQKNFEPIQKKDNGYTWEKPSEESPTIFQRHNADDNPLDDRYKHSLELNAPFKGHPHTVDQNKWETDRCDPPVFESDPQPRHYAQLSTMTKYAEEMNKAFPGYPMF